MGYDFRRPDRAREVGKVGVPSTRSTTCALFADIPLDQVSTSMTINAPGSVLLLLYQLVAEENGCPEANSPHDPERHPQGVHRPRDVHLPPKPSLRLVADTFAYCTAEIPKWNSISISGYHMAEAGATPVQEIGVHPGQRGEVPRMIRAQIFPPGRALRDRSAAWSADEEERQPGRRSDHRPGHRRAHVLRRRWPG